MNYSLNDTFENESASKKSLQELLIQGLDQKTHPTSHSDFELSFKKGLKIGTSKKPNLNRKNAVIIKKKKLLRHSITTQIPISETLELQPNVFSRFKNWLLPVPRALISGVFRFDRPYLLNFMVQLIILSQCFYLAFSAIVFSNALAWEFGNDSAILDIVMFIPVFPSMLYLLPHMIEEFTFIQATAVINRNVYYSIANRTQTKKLKQKLFVGLLDKFAEEGTELPEGKEFVQEMCTKAFEHFSSNRLGQVNFERFKVGLLDLNILFTDKEMSHLFFSMFDPSKGEG